MPFPPHLPIAPQPRDLALLRTLLESRVMTAAHASALHFDDRPEAAKKRLQKLKAAGLITNRPRNPYEPAILTLTRRGLTLLQDYGLLGDYPPLGIPALMHRAKVSDLTIRHELEVMDIQVAFHRALRDLPHWTLTKFSPWPLLNQFEASTRHGRITIKPDAFMQITETTSNSSSTDHRFFLEVDRSTETLDNLVTRLGAYWSYYTSGGFAQRHQAPRNQFKRFPFRVLVILKTQARLANLAERLFRDAPQVQRQVWLSTSKEIRTSPFAAIWYNPPDRQSDHPHHRTDPGPLFASGTLLFGNY